MSGGLLLYKTVLITVATLVSLYIAVPLLVYSYPLILHYCAFANVVYWPWQNFTNLSAAGVESVGRNFYLHLNDSVKLGVWHVLPADLISDQRDTETFLLTDEAIPIVIYVHGNGASRKRSYRVRMLNLLSQLGFHVISFDYRGYGDSTGRPSEAGLIQDTLALVDYVRRLAPSSQLIIWGHSLGSAITTGTAKHLCQHPDFSCPDAIVLESPFNKFVEAVRHNPMTRPFRWLPFFDRIFVDPFAQLLNITLDSEGNIAGINCPMLILHASDDRVVPSKLGRRLHQIAQQLAKRSTFVEFESHRGFGHRDIGAAPELSGIVREFVDSI